MPNRLTAQKRLRVYNWKAGPRRGKEGATEKQIAEKWHIVTLQEAIEYLDHEFLTNRFHVTHCGGCAILFNKDTFFSDIKVSSIYLHDTRACEQDKIKEGESGWVLQGVISRASLRRQPRGGKSTFTVIHDIRRVLPDKVVEGDPSWAIQGVISRASFRQQQRGGKPFFTVTSLHINNNYAKKRGIGKKLLLTMRAVMLD